MYDLEFGLDPGQWLPLACRRETGQAQCALPVLCLAEAPASSSLSSCPSNWPKEHSGPFPISLAIAPLLSGPLQASLASAQLTPFILIPSAVGMALGGLAKSRPKNDPSLLQSAYKTFLGLPWVQHPSDTGEGDGGSDWSERRRTSGCRWLPRRFQGASLGGEGAAGREDLRGLTAADPGPRSASSVAMLTPRVFSGAGLELRGLDQAVSHSAYDTCVCVSG